MEYSSSIKEENKPLINSGIPLVVNIIMKYYLFMISNKTSGGFCFGSVDSVKLLISLLSNLRKKVVCP